MKKIIIPILVLTAAACAKESKEAPATALQQELIITAYAGDQNTRTERTQYGTVIWNPGDEISVFCGVGANGGSRFTSQNTEKARVANFTGSMNVVTGGNNVSVEDTFFWAVYPYNSAASCDGYSITTVLPSEQLAVAGTFADDLFPALGHSKGLNMPFYNICGGIKFTLSEEGVNSVTLKGNNGEILAGTITVGLDENGLPMVNSIADGSETITVSAPSGQILETGKAYYVVFAPTVFEKGFTLTFSKGYEEGVYVRNMQTNIRRSVFGSLSCPDSGLEWKEVLTLQTVPPDNEIWYTTKDNTIINLDASSSTYNPQPFDVNVVSHTYENGKGVIKCDGPITTINDHVFGNSMFIKVNNIFLPNTIKILQTGALRGIGVEELRIPDNLQTVGSYALNSQHFKRFIGSHTSNDGRCVIIEDGFMPNYGNTLTPVHNYMAAFAPSGVSEYSLPRSVETLGWYVFAWCPELREITFNEGLKNIMGDCFYGVNLDCEIVLPSTLETLDSYAFHGCSGIKGFYGNSSFFTSDHMCLTFMNGTWINRFVGYNVTDYVIPEGIIGIENYTFDNMPNLRSVTLPSSLSNVGSSAFNNCYNLEALYGDCTDDTHKAIIFGSTLIKLVISKGVEEYTVPENITALGYNSFSKCNELREIIVSDSVTELGGYDFAWCPELKKVVLSSKLEKVNTYNPFLGSPNLEEIYFRSYLPPAYSDTQFYESDCTHLTVYVPEETLELYKQSGWCQYAPYMVGYNYDDIGEWNPDYYLSSDYSSDGTTNALQQSSDGTGIDLVFMGDAFSDRQIADGTYANVMRKAADAFFSEEPYKSMKDWFNVYIVNVVSATEGYEHGGRALSTGHGGGSLVYGNDAKVIEYAKNVIGEERLDDAVIIVLMNEDAYAGTCYMYNPPSGDYGRGLSIAYFPASSDTETFNGLVSHEAGGHGFAKLADEYAYESMGKITDEAIADTKSYEPYGWYKNVDFTSDPSQVKWSQFITDDRYASENIGCYEGGLTYWTGVWRPTDSSIMRYNTGGFNAPSRYAIWNRINKLAYGEDWIGIYEDFVAFDAPNRTPAAVARRAAKRFNCVEKQLHPLAPPVVVGHGWREELSQAK